MDKIRLEIVGMSYSNSQSGAYALILGEVDGGRRLPIIIGGFEAQAIAVEIENIKPARPLTHDLLKTLADTFDIKIIEVIIDQFKHGVFHAKLICMKDKQEYIIDSRTSDAVALALRFKCPIFTYKEIIAEAGMQIDENVANPVTLTTPEPSAPELSFDDYSVAELEELLQKAIEQEDYEKASLIRDEIKKRSTE